MFCYKIIALQMYLAFSLQPPEERLGLSFLLKLILCWPLQMFGAKTRRLRDGLSGAANIGLEER